ncbi:MAG: FAD-binding protein [Chloroflexota bacterium]
MLVTDKATWNEEAEIIIVGYGAAGAITAITAHGLGAKVIILEKQPADDHLTTSHMSGSIFISPNDAKKAMVYMDHLNKVTDDLGWTDRETLEAWVKYACQNNEWLAKLGGTVERHQGGLRGEHDLPGSESMEVYHVPGLGWGMMRLLTGAVADRKIEIRHDTRADRLLTNARGEVVGVRAHHKGKEVRFRARKAVVMTPGGFEFDEEMKLNYLKVYPTDFAGSPANTGDGIRMVQEVGAQLWHMNCVSAQWVMQFPPFPFSFVANFRGSKGTANWRRDEVRGNPCGYIIVDRYGRRYTNEETKWHAIYYELTLYDCQKLEFPRVPSYWIFDMKRLNGDRIPQWRLGPMQDRYYHWSLDNRAEVEKGWIIQGKTVKELAGKLGMDAAILEKEVRSYNRYCRQKEDPEFHRPAKHLVPLDNPPYYAVELLPGAFNTQGGPRRNARAQVLDPEGKPIPRLYAAGEFGSIFGMLYPTGGGNISECIAFGRIAGENAVGEKPAA